jgi:hypothetical protein
VQPRSIWHRSKVREKRNTINGDKLLDLCLESLSESDFAKCLHGVLISLTKEHQKSYEEISDHFVRLSGNLTALVLYLQQINQTDYRRQSM